MYVYILNLNPIVCIKSVILPINYYRRVDVHEILKTFLSSEIAEGKDALFKRSAEWILSVKE